MTTATISVKRTPISEAIVPRKGWRVDVFGSLGHLLDLTDPRAAIVGEHGTQVVLWLYESGSIIEGGEPALGGGWLVDDLSAALDRAETYVRGAALDRKTTSRLGRPCATSSYNASVGTYEKMRARLEPRRS